MIAKRRRWSRVDDQVSCFEPRLDAWGKRRVVIYRKRIYHKSAKNYQLDLFDPDDGYYEYSAVTTNRPVSGRTLWYYMGARGTHEKVYGELKGGFEADLTVTRLEPDKFLLVCGENAPGHTEMRMRRQVRADDFVTILDTTSATTHINIHGPKARDLMQKVTFSDMSNEAFPFLTAKEIDIGYATLLAIRITYVGELGWELHVPTIHAVQVYDQLIEAGREIGLRHAGMQTLNSLRLEKAYRDFGVDVDNSDNPIEAGLDFAVKLDKEGGFIGRFVERQTVGTAFECGVGRKGNGKAVIGTEMELA